MKFSKAVIYTLVALAIVFVVVMNVVLHFKHSSQSIPVQVIDMSGWKTYTDSENGFSIKYPGDIDVVSPSGPSPYARGPSVSLYFPDSYSTTTNFFGGNVTVQINDSSYCSPESFDLVDAHAVDEVQYLVESKVPDLQWNGQVLKGKRVSDISEDSKDRTDVRTLYAIAHGPQCYGLMLHTYATTYRGTTQFDQDSLMPLFAQIVSTFTFTGTEKPELTIQYPAAKVILINDSTYHTPMATVLWDSHNAGGLTISIDLQDESGNTIRRIASGVPNTGRYNWLSDETIPTGSYRLNILANNEESVVAAAETPTLMVTDPYPWQHPVTGWQTYVNTQYGFMMQYPSDFMSASEYDIQFIPKPLAYLSAEETKLLSTRGINIDITPHAATCGKDGYSNKGDGVKGTDFLGEAGLFRKVPSSDTGMNQTYVENHYYILHDGACFDVMTQVHWTNAGVYDWQPGEQEALEAKLQVDAARLSSTLEEIVTHITFTEK